MADWIPGAYALAGVVIGAVATGMMQLLAQREGSRRAREERREAQAALKIERLRPILLAVDTELAAIIDAADQARGHRIIFRAGNSYAELEQSVGRLRQAADSIWIEPGMQDVAQALGKILVAHNEYMLGYVGTDDTNRGEKLAERVKTLGELSEQGRLGRGRMREALAKLEYISG